ncbi:hypothetical protein COOONC_14682 [Cooperia oncophora]
MNGVTCTSETDKATALGNFFASVFTKDADLPFLQTNSEPVHCPCNDLYFTPDETIFLLYKKCARSLSRPLALLFNASFMLGEVPEIWKDALVTGIPKVDGAVLVSDFRPISITPTPVKVMEKIIRKRLVDWLLKNKLIPHVQHGFLPGYQL